jgi:hypothetical protein
VIVNVGVMVGVLVAAVAVRATAVATCSSTDGPQLINNMVLRITAIPIHMLFLDHILIPLLLLIKSGPNM